MLYAVVVGNQRTFVNLSDNPAYDSMSPTQSQEDHDQRVAGSADKKQLEHTYESLSNFHIHAVNIK